MKSETKKIKNSIFQRDMLKKILYFNFFFFLICVSISAEKTEILELDEEGHRQLRSKLSVSKWDGVYNEEEIICKYYKEAITYQDLKEFLVFNDNDLVDVDNSSEEKYNKQSLYWKSCNYLLFTENEETDRVLPWFQAEKVMENEYFALLIRNYDQDNLVKVIYIDKPMQLLSNKKVKEKSWVKDIYDYIYVLINGHPRD